MLGLKFNHVSKRGPGAVSDANFVITTDTRVCRYDNRRCTSDSKDDIMATLYKPVAQSPQCTNPISHNASFCTNSAMWDICLMHCRIHEMGLLNIKYRFYLKICTYVALLLCFVLSWIYHQGWGAVSYSSLSITQVKIYSSSYLIKRWFHLLNFHLNLTRKQKFTIIMDICQVELSQNENN